MPDDIQTGGTDEDGGEEDKDSPQTYTKEELEKAVADAKDTATKETNQKAWSHWQGIADTKIAEASKTSEEREAALRTELTAREKTAMEAMTPEDRSAVMLQKVYDKMAQSGVSTSAQDHKEPAPAPSTGSEPDAQAIEAQQAAVRVSVGAILKEEYGIDPAKVDWAEDKSGPEAMKQFLASVIALRDAKAKGDETEDDDSDRTDQSVGTKGATDILKQDPGDLIRSGFGKPFKVGLGN